MGQTYETRRIGDALTTLYRTVLTIPRIDVTDFLLVQMRETSWKARLESCSNICSFGPGAHTTHTTQTRGGLPNCSAYVTGADERVPCLSSAERSFSGMKCKPRFVLITTLCKHPCANPQLYMPTMVMEVSFGACSLCSLQSRFLVI